MPPPFLASAIVVLFFAATPAAQQGTSEIRGRVVDQSGAVLPGVTVVLTNEDTGVFRETISGADGSYVASQLIPGRYSILAKLSGFRKLELTRLVLQLGTTLTINLPLEVGPYEETVTVPSTTPLIDAASTGVGGNIGTAELTELPAMNRSYFATVALLPGIQFTASTMLANDTIVASGQASQNSNVTVDGGYNTDDANGASFGAQVRTPLEAIQESQVLISMYGAEHGRAGAAIVNVVTKQGTNTFRGVAFAHAASDRLTAKDFFAKEGNLPKPKVTKREWGSVVGGPIVRNKAHFFFSLERQVDRPNRTGVFSTRPSLNFSIAEDRTSWNTLIRFDHQINANHTWAVRWLREDAPQHPVVGARSTQETFGDETDRDQMIVGTLTSVFRNSRVNTFRVARTWEHSWQANECFRAQGPNDDWTGFEFGKEDAGNQALCPPQLNHLSFPVQAGIEAQGRWDSNYQVEDHFSWFVPNRKGTHDLKVGARFNYTELRQVSQHNRNGTFRFNTDLPFDSANPWTYPERLAIRVPGAYDATITSRTVELYAQDKWQIGARTTVNAGLRYDLEMIPMDETENPLFRPGQNYPIDRNNIAPRVGFTRQLDAAGKSLVRAGYGLFYNRTILGVIEDAVLAPKFASSFVARFPNDTVDPGPRRGEFPTDPFLVNGPVITQELLNQRFPPGTRQRNTGVVVFDSPNRQQPFAHQFTLGYVRELAYSLAVHADYVRIANKQMFLSRNLNPMVRADTTSTGAITRVDAFGVLGEPYSQQVWALENGGESVYDAINLQLDKRYADAWSARVSYSLSYSRGTAESQDAKNTDQFLTDLRLDNRWGPTGVDRRHILAISTRTEIPKTGGATLSAVVRYMTGAPFTIFDGDIDADQNGELNDPLSAGTYSGTAPNAMVDVANEGGRNGAYGPDYLQADVRAGWRLRIAKNTLELLVDVYNITNRTNFENPVNAAAGADRRLIDTFLVPTVLRGGGFPRQAQLGVRYTF
jgi:Carboxypeptidase regulatory-like domain/TonB dependent receptor